MAPRAAGGTPTQQDRRWVWWLLALLAAAAAAIGVPAARSRRRSALPAELDAAAAEDVLTMLSRLNSEFGKTIVLVTHDPHAAKFAKTVRHLEKGQLLPVGLLRV